MTGATLHALVRQNARSAGSSVALICDDIRFTYADLDVRSRRIVAMLRSMDIGAGNRIAWIGQNSHRWLETLVAASHIGAILCSLNWRQSDDELARMLEYTEPALVLWQQQDLASTAENLRARLADMRWIAHDDPSEAGLDGLAARFEAAADEGCDDPDAAVLMLPVADPSGEPLASLLSHGNLLVPALLMAQLQAIDRETVNLASAPLFHIAALFSIVPTLVMRGTNVMIARPEARILCEAIDGYRCTHGFLLAPTAEAMVEANADRRYDLSTFRSSLQIASWRAMVAQDDSAWGRSPGGFGQTETHMALLAALGNGASMTSGWAAPYCEVRIVDAGGADVPVGEIGEIIVRGPNVHLGYWRREERTRARFSGGWWHSRDLGRELPGGMISFVGPMGRMIKCGAENVYGSEVERCLAAHPDVAEVAVIGIPDSVWVQSVRAIIVLREGMTLSELALQDHCRASLASYKKPRSVIFRDEPLPRNGPAIDYAALDASYGGGGYPGEGTRSA